MLRQIGPDVGLAKIDAGSREHFLQLWQRVFDGLANFGVRRSKYGRCLVSVDLQGNLHGAKLRWILQVPGWEWAAADRPNAFHVGKTFMTRTGAQIEADDIIASAKEWEG